MLDTDDITKRWIEAGSAFPDPALFQFRKGVCYRDHFPVANLQYREPFRQVTFDIGKYIGFFSGHLRRYRESLWLFLTILGVFGKVCGFF